ncbi:hypothetical protein AMELA_G00038730 [Ameiurus melas]|uniref:Uncharacterized protein n=1 Tax=Ameiurus melas TaxID=219545 RepID=A0A7J6B947_AMEME|nr:hypothetical protein AMELA_G00038730 [Ameiurus melas]
MKTKEHTRQALNINIESLIERADTPWTTSRIKAACIKLREKALPGRVCVRLEKFGDICSLKVETVCNRVSLEYGY